MPVARPHQSRAARRSAALIVLFGLAVGAPAVVLRAQGRGTLPLPPLEQRTGPDWDRRRLVGQAAGDSRCPPATSRSSSFFSRATDGPVLTDPQIQQPGSIAFDGNGRMYVLELRTYMLDADSKDELAPTSRISRWEDKNNDGVYETGTTFVDGLIFPRFVTPLGDGVILDQGIERRRSLDVHRHEQGRCGRQARNSSRPTSAAPPTSSTRKPSSRG